MATYTVNADQLAYRSGGVWTNGKARQGVYGGTRYEGAIRFAGLSELNFSNIAISQLELRVTFLRAGGSSTKNLTFYKATSNTISGAIRGASIGAISVGDAYGRTVTLTFNAGANSGLFNTIRSYLSEGNRVLCIYVPRTRGTYSGGYCYDYLGISSASITLTYEYLQSDGTMATTSVAAGSAARLNITAYNSAYTHKVVWKFGSYVKQNVLQYICRKEIREETSMTIISSQHYINWETVEEKMEQLKGKSNITIPCAYVGEIDGEEYAIQIDGHHTLVAARELGIEVEFDVHEDDEGLEGEALLDARYMDGDYYNVETSDPANDIFDLVW